MAEYEDLVVERRGPDGSVAVVILDRPHRANSYTVRMVAELHRVVADLEADESVRAAVFTGTGRHFCAGGDLREEGRDGRFVDSVRRLLVRIAELPHPTIAAINGAAIGGGCELAISCDFRYMDESATIGLPEVKFGAVAYAGGTQRLTRLLGVAKSLELHLLGDAVGAAEAYRVGLVNAVTARGAVLEGALETAVELARRPPQAVRAAKQLVTAAPDLDLATGLRIEASMARALHPMVEAGLADAAELDETYARILGGRDDVSSDGDAREEDDDR